MVEDLTSLAVIAIVAFLCPVICSLLPRKVIPETVLLLIAGAALGPYGLNVIHITDATSLMSNLGLAFLFLLAGYEISPKSLTGHEGRRGAITWIISFAVALGVVWLGPSFKDGSYIDGLAVTIAMTTTAMGTLLPILQERGILKTKIGEEIVSYGTWGELLPVLAMTLLLSTRAEWLTVVILLSFLAIAVIAAILPKRARKAGSFVANFVVANQDTNSEMLTRSVIMLLVGLIALSAVFNLDIVLGAFAAGFILRYVIPEGNDTMEMKHNAIGYGFFIPLFFVISGAKIDMGAVASNPALLVTFVLLLLVVRAVPIYIGLSTGKESRHLSVQARLTVSLYCTTALPIIVAVTVVAVQSGAMSQATASVFVAAGAVTVFLMPLLASVTIHTVNADLGEAAKQIRRHPKWFIPILINHRRLERKRSAEQKKYEYSVGPCSDDEVLKDGVCKPRNEK